MSASKPLGLTPFDSSVLGISFGASKNPPYGELGFMTSSILKWKFPEALFRPRFLRMCGQGLITVEDWDMLHLGIKDRKIETTDKGVEALRELGIFHGGDYSYYKYLDPFENYAKHPEKFDRFLPHRVRTNFGDDSREKALKSMKMDRR